MDKIEQLIKKLSDLKEDLTKGINESYASEPNMSKEEQKVNLNNPYNEQPQKSSKKKRDDKLDLASPGHQFGNVKKADECHEDDPQHEKKEQDKAKKIKENAEEILDMHKGETCSIAKNGQWSLKKAKDMSGDNIDSSMLMSELQAIEHHIKEIKEKINSKDIAPDWVKSQISQASNDLSGVAHYILGLKGESKSMSKAEYGLEKAAIDYKKMPVKKITSAKAVSGHGYELTHHYPDGSTSGPHAAEIEQTGIRLKTPGKTHAIHLKGQSEPIHTDEATAKEALKQGTFNFDAYTKKR